MLKVAIAFAMLAAPLAATAVLVDGVAARVNERTITIGDVMAMIAPVRRQLLQTYSGEELHQRSLTVYTNALDTLVARRLIVDLYETQDRISLPEWLVDRRVDEIVRDMFQGDRTAMMAALAEDHLTYDSWRAGLRDHMIVSYMRRFYVDDKITLAPTDVRNEYERNIARYKKPAKIKLRMIVMGKGPSQETAVAKRSQAEELRKRALAGGDFGALAQDVSEGSKSKSGGDWGWIEPRMLRSELAEAAMALKPAEISPVIDLGEELYLLKLEGRQNESVLPFEEAQPEIELEMHKTESEKMYKAWIARLKENSYVEVLDVDPFKEQPGDAGR